jgi:hypothetical protein
MLRFTTYRWISPFLKNTLYSPLPHTLVILFVLIVYLTARVFMQMVLKLKTKKTQLGNSEL